MDNIFVRELGIFIAVLVVFVGLVPALTRGHQAEPVEQANDKAARGADLAAASRGRGKSRRRRARERDAARAGK